MDNKQERNRKKKRKKERKGSISEFRFVFAQFFYVLFTKMQLKFRGFDLDNTHSSASCTTTLGCSRTQSVGGKNKDR